MTDSELIKAMENKVQGSDYACFEDYEILDLIERQKAELEAIKYKKALVFKLSEEQINEIKEQINETKGGPLKPVEYNERKIKAEAYKEFATKIYQAFAIENTRDGYLDCTPNYTRLMECVDNVLKELVGETE